MVTPAARIAIVEALTAFGPADSPASWRAEGWAMAERLARDALADGASEIHLAVGPAAGEVAHRLFADLATPSGSSRAGLRADRTEDWTPLRVVPGDDPEATFLRLVGRVDAVLLIVPETGGELARLAALADRFGLPVRGASAELIQLASDKLATARLPGAIPAEALGTLDGTELAEAVTRFGPRLVLKPIDGAGSLGAFRVTLPDPPASASHVWALAIEFARAAVPESRWIIQPFRPGRPASAALLRNDDGRVFILPPAAQTIQFEPVRPGLESIRYRGGEFPLDDASGLVGSRTRRLLDPVVNGLPPWTGWIGADLIFGDTADGSADALVEINPRLTTSYVGVSAALGPSAIRLALGCFADDLVVESLPGKPPVRFHPEGVSTLS